MRIGTETPTAAAAVTSKKSRGEHRVQLRSLVACMRAGRAIAGFVLGAMFWRYGRICYGACAKFIKLHIAEPPMKNVPQKSEVLTYHPSQIVTGWSLHRH